MRLTKRRGLAVAAACTASLFAASAPLAARGPHPKQPKHPAHPGKPSPSYDVKGPRPGKPVSPKPRKAVFMAGLLGKNEVGTNGERRAGDLDGQGGATVTVTASQLCFGIVVQGIDTPTLAHVHQGRNNRNGPIVVTLTPPSAGDPGASSGCVDVDPTLLDSIRKHPHAFYVNVHTQAFPNGALRGQLHRAPRH